MASLNDHKHAAMALALVIPADQATGDLERLYLLDILAAGPVDGTLTIDDLWHLLFDEALIDPGSFNDRAYAWLGTKLQTEGALNERWFGYWSGLSGL